MLIVYGTINRLSDFISGCCGDRRTRVCVFLVQSSSSEREEESVCYIKALY